jgi:hypothetical protein
MKKQFSEKAFREYLDQTNPRGIEISEDWFKDAKDLQKHSNQTFRTIYNEWIETHERENGYNSTGCYS